MHIEHRKLLDKKYNSKFTPKFDLTDNGLENYALRIISDYEIGETPDAAMTNILVWLHKLVHSAVEHGRREAKKNIDYKIREKLKDFLEL